ncbi:MAG TPA: ATP-dependent DNA helicase [Acidimicrobiales bacterium]|nr:ATP-dependent DNA helicase [Acidimicrobiales bacterium]
MPPDDSESRSPAAQDAIGVLDELTGELEGGEHREAQRLMTAAVADALDRDRHLVVEAGTGTGKSLAYLVAAVRSGRRVVVATATKALQDQLSGKDLPWLAAHGDSPVDFAVLKGRSNYVCRQRLSELNDPKSAGQTQLEGLSGRPSPSELATITEWASHSTTGDRAELDTEPDPRTWAAVSMTSQECPGAAKCPMGETCFAEAARDRAAEADVVVVNQHLWGLDVANDRQLLPEHDVVVIDEAHQLVDVISTTAGIELTEARFTAVAAAARAVLEDADAIGALDNVTADWKAALEPLVGDRLTDGPTGAIADLVGLATSRTEKILASVRGIDPGGHAQVATRRDRAVNLASSLIDDLHLITGKPEGAVVWVAGPTHRISLCRAPIDVAGFLADRAWGETIAICTSATIAANFVSAAGLPAPSTDELRLMSPFDYAANTMLYCPPTLPTPGAAGYSDALCDELEALITAAGGATLALFTSFRALDDAVDALRERLDVEILSQRDRPKPALIAEFAAERSTCLFATQSFFQGVDVPGDACQLVTIDRIPFPRPDDPVLSARRETIGPRAFAEVDVPRAATLLAQAAGRLVRHSDDRGVVAVLDSRLATRRSYRWDLINALPPMKRTRDRAEIEAFLTEVRPTL